MKTVLAIAVVTTAVIPGAGLAAAAPTAGMTAPDVVRDLTDAGYTVAINGAAGVPLSQCTVTGVHGVPADNYRAPNQFTTVYVDVECESEG